MSNRSRRGYIFCTACDHGFVWHTETDKNGKTHRRATTCGRCGGRYQIEAN